MATFAELLTEVYLLTNRPDQVELTKQAVKAATLKLHNSDFYVRDMREESLILSAPAKFVQLDFKSLFPRFRHLKYLRATDASFTDEGIKYGVLTPGQVLDSYSVNRENVCYISGDIIQLRSYADVQYLLMGFYQHPDVTEANYTSWIAQDYPDAIVYDAAAKVLKILGLAERAQQLATDAVEFFIEMHNATIAMEVA